MIATLQIQDRAVRTLRCDDGFPGVVLADVLEPFGKRVDKTVPLMDGWARWRIARVPSRGGAFDGRGGGPQDTTLLHAEDVPLLLARLDQRGMTDEVKALHLRFLVACRDVLAAHFFRREEPMPTIDLLAAIEVAVRAAVSAALGQRPAAPARRTVQAQVDPARGLRAAAALVELVVERGCVARRRDLPALLRARLGQCSTRLADEAVEVLGDAVVLERHTRRTALYIDGSRLSREVLGKCSPEISERALALRPLSMTH